jgi:hypothetical protein
VIRARPQLTGPAAQVTLGELGSEQLGDRLTARRIYNTGEELFFEFADPGVDRFEFCFDCHSITAIDSDQRCPNAVAPSALSCVLRGSVRPLPY